MENQDNPRENYSIYQDSHKAFDILTPLEKLNCKCDEKAKSLIIEAGTRTFPFPFTLSSPYLRSSKKNLLVNSKDELTHYINLHWVEPYLKKKLKVDILFIDWEVRKLIFKKIPLHPHW